ncbi:alkaline phosphatase D family protein [Sulfurimonas sp. HSL3-7]|uniref:alkaline phosphatase D family protein n=1 Tax=Sulfonitrofixus jiaomeiensis TaxID=3131938 RepID=UPI0031F8F7F5
MVVRFHNLLFCLLLLTSASYAQQDLKISHGPMLGTVTDRSAAIWLRTTVPGRVSVRLSEIRPFAKELIQRIRTDENSDNTAVFHCNDLKPDTRYRYIAQADDSSYEGRFTTPGPALKKRALRVVYGYGYKHAENRMKSGRSIFMEMASRKADLVFFIGDFPYTETGAKEEVREGNRKLRSVPGFRQLTASTPTYGIYDDHDFGPNDCDGTHKNADEALAAFKEYWPNPSYGQPDNKGIYTSFVVGNAEFFLLDGRYQARKRQKTMLGKRQFEWLCRELKNSKSRYKVLVSGTQFSREKNDSWGGRYYVNEREKLFSFIFENNITGVIGISGDVHRSDVHKLPIGKDRLFYDFTPGALSRVHRTPQIPRPATTLHSYGKSGDNNMFGEIVFNPSSDKDVAVVFRSFSAKNGLIYEHRLSPADLAIQPAP